MFGINEDRSPAGRRSAQAGLSDPDKVLSIVERCPTLAFYGLVYEVAASPKGAVHPVA